MTIIRVGELLKVARVGRHMSQLELAEAAKLRLHQYSRIERNLQVPSPDEMTRLVTALSTDDAAKRQRVPRPTLQEVLDELARRRTDPIREAESVS
jgi:transcriptional regulator with XRE-family HTH domain